MQSTRTWRIRAIVLSVCLAAAEPAHATGGFPAAIQAHLGLSYRPPCSVCHEGGVTSMGTVNTPFGSALRQRGLRAGDETSLRAALDQLAQQAVDSDGDGTPDIPELRVGADPNRPGGASLVGEDPTYGCGGRVTGSEPGRRAWTGVLVVLALGWSRRKTRLLVRSSCKPLDL